MQASGAQACNFIKIDTLAQVFSGEICEVSKNTFFTEHLWATVFMPFKNLPFCVGYWHVLEYNLGGQPQSTPAKWTAKLGVLVKIYVFSWDHMVFLWVIYLFPEKMTLVYAQQIATYSCPACCGALPNNWVSCKEYQFWIYLWHKNNWILWRMNSFSSSLQRQ